MEFTFYGFFLMLLTPYMFLHQYIIQHTYPVIHHL